MLEVGDEWHEIGGAYFTEDTVLLLKQGLNDVDAVEVEYRLLRGFLAQGTFAIDEAISELISGHPDLSLQEIAVRPLEDTLNKLKRIVETTYRCVKRITPRPKSMPPISTTSQAALISTIVKKLHEMVEAGKVMDGALKNLCGDVSLQGSPYDMWAHYADALDIDSAKQAFFSVVRFFVMEERSKNRGLGDMIADLVDVLDRAGYGSK